MCLCVCVCVLLKLCSPRHFLSFLWRSAEPLEQCRKAQVLVLNSQQPHRRFQTASESKKKKIRHHFGSARILLFTKKHIFTFMRCIFTYTFPILYFSAGVAVRNETDFCRTYCEELFCGNFEFRSVFLDSAALLSGHILVQSVCLFVLKKMLHHSCLVISSPGFYTNACSTTITIQVIIRIP